MNSILRSLGHGATKTQIMYRAYLSFTQLKEYLNLLEQKSLLASESGSNLYKLTEKGLRFMNAFDEIQELVSPTTKEGEASAAAVASSLKRREVFNF